MGLGRRGNVVTPKSLYPRSSESIRLNLRNTTGIMESIYQTLGPHICYNVAICNISNIIKK